MIATHAWEIILYRTWAELKAETSRAYLGVAWWVVEPILYMGAFYMIFSVLFGAAYDGYIEFLLCGLVPWKWFASTIQTGSNSVVSNLGLINQTYFPKYILVASVVLANLAKFTFVLGLLCLFLLLTGKMSLHSTAAILATVLSELSIIVGATAIAAALVPLVPDLKLIIDNAMLLLFFLSGVFYDIATRVGSSAEILAWNPMVGVLANYRGSLLANHEFDWRAIVYALSVGVCMTAFGLYLLTKLDRRFAKIVS